MCVKKCGFYDFMDDNLGLLCFHSVFIPLSMAAFVSFIFLFLLAFTDSVYQSRSKFLHYFFSNPTLMHDLISP